VLVVIRRSTLLLLVVCAIALGACRARATVDVRLDADGSGEVQVRVRLDADAVRVVRGLGDDLDSAVRLDGLTDAGWTVGEWTPDDDGGVRLQLRKPFVDAADLESVLGEIAGDGATVTVDVEQSRGVWRDRDTLRIGVGTEQLGAVLAADPQLAASMRAAGLSPDALDRRFAQRLARSLRIEIVATIPGADQRVELRPGETAVLDVESSRTHPGALVGAGSGLVAVALGVGLVLVALRAGRGRGGVRAPR
jgi:hypothetical protein